MSDCYPTRAYDLLNDIERNIVEEYVLYIVNEQKRKKQRLLLALNLPFPTEYIKKSRNALYKPIIKAAIAERIKEESDKEDISPDRVINEYAKIAFSDITDFLCTVGFGDLTVKSLEDIPEDKKGAIKTIETKPGPYGLSTKITLHDKLPALKTLAEYMGMIAAERQPILAEYVKQELKTIEMRQLEAPEVVYTELLETAVK